MAKGRACGKFILLGEHFVVSGAPALAFPLEDLWCEVRVAPASHPQYVADLPGVEDRGVIETLMARALYAVVDAMRMDPASQPFKVVSTSNFPVSRGLGSSASFAVALTRAVDEYRQAIINEKADWDELVKATTAVEKIFHGSPSGVDAGVILSSRPIRFENGAILRDVVNKAVDFIVLDGGSRDNCGSLVKQVQEFRARNVDQWSAMNAAVRGLVDKCEKALSSGDAMGVAQAVREKHAILAELGLSNPNIDSIINDGVMYGALAGKVSGAGGGGAVVLVTRKGDGKKIGNALKDAGRPVIAIDSGGLRA